MRRDRPVPVDRDVIREVIALLTLIVNAGEDDHIGRSAVLEMGADAANLRAALRDAITEEAET